MIGSIQLPFTHLDAWRQLFAKMTELLVGQASQQQQQQQQQQQHVLVHAGQAMHELADLVGYIRERKEYELEILANGFASSGDADTFQTLGEKIFLSSVVCVDEHGSMHNECVLILSSHHLVLLKLTHHTPGSGGGSGSGSGSGESLLRIEYKIPLMGSADRSSKNSNSSSINSKHSNKNHHQQQHHHHQQQQQQRPIQMRKLGAASIEWIKNKYGGGGGGNVSQLTAALTKFMFELSDVTCETTSRLLVICSNSYDHQIWLEMIANRLALLRNYPTTATAPSTDTEVAKSKESPTSKPAGGGGSVCLSPSKRSTHNTFVNSPTHRQTLAAAATSQQPPSQGAQRRANNNNKVFSIRPHAPLVPHFQLSASSSACVTSVSACSDASISKRFMYNKAKIADPMGKCALFLLFFFFFFLYLSLRALSIIMCIG